MLTGFFSQHLTTAGLAETDGVALHRENLAKALGAVELEPIEDAPFEADTRFTAAPGFGLATIATSPTRVFRRPELSPDSEESFFVVILCPGSDGLHITQGRHDLHLTAGQAVLLRDTEPHRSMTRRARGHNLRLPTASAARLLSDFDGAMGRIMPADTPGLPLFAAYLDGVHDALRASPALRPLAPRHIRDLLAVVAGATRDAEADAMGRGVAAARLRAIKLDMEARFDRTDLSAELIGLRQGISGRYVQKLFEREGTTFATHLNELRLVQVHRQLTDPTAARLSVAEIAFAAGFNELSTFYRLFRRRHGTTPSEIRHEALDGAERSPPRVC